MKKAKSYGEWYFEKVDGQVFVITFAVGLLILTLIIASVLNNFYQEKFIGEITAYTEEKVQLLETLEDKVYRLNESEYLSDLTDDMIGCETTIKDDRYILEYYIRADKDMIFAKPLALIVEADQADEVISTRYNYYSAEDYEDYVKDSIRDSAIIMGMCFGFLILTVIIFVFSVAAEISLDMQKRSKTS